MNHFKKCPFKKRPIIYENIPETDTNCTENVPQDLSLKRKTEDLHIGESKKRRINTPLGLSKHFTSSDQEKINSIKCASAALCSQSTNSQHNPITPPPSTVVENDRVKINPLHQEQDSRFHLRQYQFSHPENFAISYNSPSSFGISLFSAPQSGRSYFDGLRPWNDINVYSQRESITFQSNLSYHLTPPSSPASPLSASTSEPEDLSMKSYIPLPALYHDSHKSACFQSTTTSGKGNRKSHIQKGHHHRFKCEKCSKSYSTLTGLSKHGQFHCPAAEYNSIKKSFACKSCDKIYTSLGALKMHIRTHTLPCKCSICGKAFSRPWLLQGHIRTHTGEKPFTCSHCCRAFADRSNLRAHQQIHAEVKKYICEFCKKSFSRMSLLNKHTQAGCSQFKVPYI